jgi:hypothetical protein
MRQGGKKQNIGRQKQDMPASGSMRTAHRQRGEFAPGDDKGVWGEPQANRAS